MCEYYEPIPIAEEASARVYHEQEGRPRMHEPLPVRLITVEDARLIAAAGLEKQLDEFYIDLLGFERETDERVEYRAENHRLIFEFLEPPVQRDYMRPLGIEVNSLREIEQKLIDAQIEYVRQKAIHPGYESLLLLDVAGNWIEVSEISTLL